MKVWVWVQSSKEWEMVAECPSNWAFWVTTTLKLGAPDLIIQYGTEKPSVPFGTSL